MIRAIHHTAISTGDIERSLGFYRDLLGFREVDRFGWRRGSAAMDAITGLTDSESKVALLRLDNAFLELFEYSSPQPAPGDPHRPVCDHGITHLCLEVTDVDAEYAEFEWRKDFGQGRKFTGFWLLAVTAWEIEVGETGLDLDVEIRTERRSTVPVEFNVVLPD